MIHRMSGEAITNDHLHDDCFVSPFNSAVITGERAKDKRPVRLNRSLSVQGSILREQFNRPQHDRFAIRKDSSPFDGIGRRLLLAASIGCDEQNDRRSEEVATARENAR